MPPAGASARGLQAAVPVSRLCLSHSPFPLARSYAAFSRCAAALAVSGSVTAQLAAARLPAVVAYRAHPLTEARRLIPAPSLPRPLTSRRAAQWLAARRAAVRHVALPNLVLRREAVPELVFGAATPAALAGALAALLGEGSFHSSSVSEFPTSSPKY